MSPTVLIVPGLRDHVQAHWQTLLAAQLPKVHSVPPMGREDLDCASAHAHRVVGALLATPPDFDQPMPEGYPTLAALQAGGWLPVPRKTLPFRSLVATSDNDPLADRARVLALAKDWGSETVDLGAVGHLNPASGYGEWAMAKALIDQFQRTSG